MTRHVSSLDYRDYGDDWGSKWKRDLLGEAYERMAVEEETPEETIQFLVNFRGIDSETAREVVKAAWRALRLDTAEKSEGLRKRWRG